MGTHSGPHDNASQRLPRRRLLVLSLLVTLTVVAWGVLVLAAIDFGREARTGDSEAWTFLAVAALGATACLFVAIILLGRMVSLVPRRDEPARPARAPGGRRAAR